MGSNKTDRLSPPAGSQLPLWSSSTDRGIVVEAINIYLHKCSLGRTGHYTAVLDFQLPSPSLHVEMAGNIKNKKKRGIIISIFFMCFLSGRIFGFQASHWPVTR